MSIPYRRIVAFRPAKDGTPAQSVLACGHVVLLLEGDSIGLPVHCDACGNHWKE